MRNILRIKKLSRPDDDFYLQNRLTTDTALSSTFFFSYIITVFVAARKGMTTAINSEGHMCPIFSSIPLCVILLTVRSFRKITTMSISVSFEMSIGNLRKYMIWCNFRKAILKFWFDSVLQKADCLLWRATVLFPNLFLELYVHYVRKYSSKILDVKKYLPLQKTSKIKFKYHKFFVLVPVEKQFTVLLSDR